jgi:hypothetical protein
MPYFDYCSTLYIYFPKSALQKIYNTYNFCLSKLLRINPKKGEVFDIIKFDNHLGKFNLNNFQQRIFMRLSKFIYKLFKSAQSPYQLKNEFKRNGELNKSYYLRNLNEFYVPSMGKFNYHMKETFGYFYTKFINNFILDELKFNQQLFINRVKNNVNLKINEFIKLFNKFDLDYQVRNY